jgi:polyisoprenyl-teichoic acid--peptidoglycan teichoic acid transferase
MSDLELLDDLDDPVPFLVTLELVAAARARGVQIRRRRRVRRAAAAVPLVALALVVGGAAYVAHRADQVRRVEVGSGLLTPVGGGRPFNLLVVGTDGPRGQSGVRTDSIVVVRVDQDAHRVSLLSIPRDLVPTPRGARIDTLLGQHGPQALIEEVEGDLHIPIAHYVEIDPGGLAALVDQVGGIQVDAPALTRDPATGLVLPPGCDTLDGQATVALVRSRGAQMQVGPPGAQSWAYSATGDLGREADQQVVARILAARLLTMPLDPSSLTTLLGVFADHTTVDAGLSLGELADLARWGHALAGGDLTTGTLPVTPFVQASGGDVLLLSRDAPAAVSAFLGGSGPAPGSGSGSGGVPALIRPCS